VKEIPAGSPRAFTRHVEKELASFTPELFVIGKGCDSNIPVVGFSPNYWHVEKKLLQMLREVGCKIMLLSLDDPNDCGFTITAFDMELIDYMGTCCMGTEGVYNRYGKTKVFEFWPAWDPTWGEVSTPAEKDCDFLIVGTPYLKGDHLTMGPSIARRDIAMKAVSMGLNVRIYGPDNWLQEEHGGHPSLAPVYCGHAGGDQWPAIFRGAKVVYNSFVRQGYRYLNDRVPIVGGYGSFLLMEQQEGLDEEFEHEKDCGYHAYGDINSFEKELAKFVRDDDLREDCAHNMQLKIISNHTYAHRAHMLDRLWKGGAV
jgi:hypothetical protein